jgi:hypothetical protein
MKNFLVGLVVGALVVFFWPDPDFRTSLQPAKSGEASVEFVRIERDTVVLRDTITVEKPQSWSPEPLLLPRRPKATFGPSGSVRVQAFDTRSRDLVTFEAPAPNRWHAGAGYSTQGPFLTGGRSFGRFEAFVVAGPGLFGVGATIRF